MEIDEIVSILHYKSGLRQGESKDLQETRNFASEKPVLIPKISSLRYLTKLSTFAEMFRNEALYGHSLPLGCRGGNSPPPIIDLGQPQEDAPIIYIKTNSGGSNAGRIYCMQVHNPDQQNIVSLWTKYSQAAKKAKSNGSWSYQKAARRIYHSALFQFAASTLIMMVRSC
jgi:hypothetical protein